MDKIFLVDKKENWTSNDVVIKSKGKLHTKRVGHCGTLDPFATGLLILCANKATKVVRYLEEEDKTYIATLKLGEKSSTGDTEGEIIETKEVKAMDESYINDVLKSFLGKQSQLPPMYSAVKQDGLKLYEYARMNIEVERKLRDIEIYDIKLLDYKDNILRFEVKCSKGTYIRVLGEDIALKLGTVGHLIALRRTSIGKYDVKDAIDVEEMCYEKGIDLVDGLKAFKKIEVNESKAIDVKNGKKIIIKDENASKVLLVHKNKALALYELDKDDIYKCLRGLWNE